MNWSAFLFFCLWIYIFFFSLHIDMKNNYNCFMHAYIHLVDV